MANIGSLVVDLQANSAAFIGEMNKASAATQRAATTMQTALGSMSQRFNAVTDHVRGFVAAFTVERIAHFAWNLVETAGGLGELAQQLGVTTDFLQAMQYAAAQSGVSSEQLQTSFIRLNDAIGQAVGHSDEAIKKFQDLGIFVLDASGNARTAEAVFEDLAERIRRTESPARQLAIANEFLGRTGARLLPLMLQGAEGIRRAREEAERAGVLITPEMIENADKLADSIAALKIQIQALITPGAIEFFERLRDIIQFIAEWRGRGDQLVDQAFGRNDQENALADEMVRLRGESERLQDAIESVDIGGAFAMPTQEAVQHLEELRVELDHVRERMDEVRIQLEDMGWRGNRWADPGAPLRLPTLHPRGVSNPTGRNAGEGVQRVLDDLQRQTVALNTPNADRFTFINQWVEKLPQAISRTGQMADRVRNLAAALYDGQQQQRVMNEAFDEGQRIAEQFMTQQEQLASQLDHLNFLRDAGAISQQTYNRAVSDAYLKTTGLGDAVESLGQAFSSAFESAIVKGESLRNVLGSLLQDIGKILIKVAILTPLENAIKSGLGSLIGSFGGSVSGGGGGHGSAMGDILTARGPIALASGGIVDRPYLSLIGEGAMNEAVVPLPDGRRIPVDMRGGGRGGVTNVINIDARDAAPGVEIRLRSYIEQRLGQQLAAIPMLSRDGGGFARQTGARKR